MLEVMESGPSWFPTRRLPASVALTLLLLASPVSVLAVSCDCGCGRYAQLLETLMEGSTESDAWLDRCGGACAIAWANCEARHAHDDSWPPLASEADSKSSELAEDERPVVRSSEHEDTIYLP